MTVDRNLADSFADVVSSANDSKASGSCYGTAVVQGSDTYVRIDGSTVLTPVKSTVEMSSGDRVSLTVENHEAVVTGNITAKAASGKYFAEMLESGEYSINAKSVTIDSEGDFTVNAGGTVNFNDKLVLNESGELSLSITSLSIGGSEEVTDLDDLKGKDGDPGEPGVDVTSQYVYYTPNYGLAITPSPNSTSSCHSVMKSDGFYVMDGATNLASFKSDIVKLASGNLIVSYSGNMAWLSGTGGTAISYGSSSNYSNVYCNFENNRYTSKVQSVYGSYSSGIVSQAWSSGSYTNICGENVCINSKSAVSASVDSSGNVTLYLN